MAIRVELNFTDPTHTHVWVWSSATACFDVPDCDYVLDPDGSGQLIFGPKLMKKLKKDTVVTNIKATWDPVKDEMYLVITIKLGKWVPSFNITTTCIGVDEAVGAVSKKMQLTRRKRPY